MICCPLRAAGAKEGRLRRNEPRHVRPICDLRQCKDRLTQSLHACAMAQSLPHGDILLAACAEFRPMLRYWIIIAHMPTIRKQVHAYCGPCLTNAEHIHHSVFFPRLVSPPLVSSHPRDPLPPHLHAPHIQTPHSSCRPQTERRKGLVPQRTAGHKSPARAWSPSVHLWQELIAPWFGSLSHGFRTRSSPYSFPGSLR